MATELLPCPFCGRPAKTLPPEPRGTEHRVVVMCSAEYVDECSVAPSVTDDSLRAAAARWNARVTPAETVR